MESTIGYLCCKKISSKCTSRKTIDFTTDHCIFFPPRGRANTFKILDEYHSFTTCCVKGLYMTNPKISTIFRKCLQQ